MPFSTLRKQPAQRALRGLQQS